MEPHSKEPSADQLLKALGHPLRRRILRAIDGEVGSPAKLAEKLGEPLPSVSYHVRALDRCGALRPAGTRAVRGTIEHFYRGVVEVEWARKALESSRREDAEGAGRAPSRR